MGRSYYVNYGFYSPALTTVPCNDRDRHELGPTAVVLSHGVGETVTPETFTDFRTEFL